jgi:hypothetical protein
MTIGCGRRESTPGHTFSLKLNFGLGGLTVDVGMCGGAGWKIVLGDWDRTEDGCEEEG